MKERIGVQGGFIPATVGGCWAGDCQVKLGRLDWHSRAGWVTRAGSRREILTVSLRGRMEALGSETGRGLERRRKLKILTRGGGVLGSKQEDLSGNYGLCRWEIGLAGRRVEF